MERPVGRLRDKLDIAIDCLCRMSLGARSLPHRLWVGVAMSSSVAHCQGQGAAVSSGVAVALSMLSGPGPSTTECRHGGARWPCLPGRWSPLCPG